MIKDEIVVIANKQWESLGFCGCCNPDDGIDVLAKILIGIKDNNMNKAAGDIVLSVIKKDMDNTADLILYLLDYVGLTEHVCSIQGSFLSEKGVSALNDFKGVLNND